MLIEALGRANTALSLVRELFQLLGERGIVPPAALLELLDGDLLILQEDAAHGRMPDGDVQIREHEFLIETLRELPEFRVGHDPGGR